MPRDIEDGSVDRETHTGLEGLQRKTAFSMPGGHNWRRGHDDNIVLFKQCLVLVTQLAPDIRRLPVQTREARHQIEAIDDDILRRGESALEAIVGPWQS